jgi:DNA-binding NarL/FixJ family response regulator
MPCRILIADDNERVRRGVSALLSLEPMYEVCGEAANGSEALQKAVALEPDLILLDISMPDVNGLEVARIVRRDAPAIKILVMSQHDPDQLLPRAMAAGANGCVDKGRLAADLLPAIKLFFPS